MKVGVSLSILAQAGRPDVAVYKVDIGLPNTVAIVVRGQFTGNEILRFKAAIADIDPNKRIALLLYVIENEIHHRGQGYVYLRSLGIEPPAFWDRS